MNKVENESLKNYVLEEIDMLEHDADWLKAVADELRKKLKAVETEQDVDEFNKYSERMLYGDGCELKMLRL